MSSKPESVPEATIPDSRPLLRGGVIELQGRDAGAFAQSQLMNDVRALADGRWQWTGWLNPKGRVITLGALMRLAEDHYWLLLPDHPAARLAEDLRRFVFRSKLTLTTREDLSTGGAWCAPEALGSTALHSRFDRRDEVVRLDWSGARPRTLLVGTETDLEPALAPRRETRASATAWAAQDLAHGLPRLGELLVAAYTPQMLGLARLDAYSVKKGCYPGQEIVARTHFLGQAKRGLCRLQSADPLQAGDVLLIDDAPAGDVICAASDGDHHEALAVLPLDVGTRMLSGPPRAAVVKVIDFEQGLAR